MTSEEGQDSQGSLLLEAAQHFSDVPYPKNLLGNLIKVMILGLHTPE